MGAPSTATTEPAGDSTVKEEGETARPVQTLPPAPAHEHRSSRADERLWLEAVHDEAATIRLHAYCLDCGAVRSTLPKRGRPMGHFQRALGNLAGILEDHPKYAKLAQVHARLIAKALEAVPDFDDPYSMPYETQWSIFVAAVQRVRPDLPLELLEDALPREPRKVHPAFIDLIAQARKEVPQAATSG